MTFDRAELPLLPGGKCCALALLNTIPKFLKEKHQFLSALSSKSSIPICSICMISKGYKMFFENFVSQKMAYVTNRLQKYEQWQRLLLGDCIPGSRVNAMNNNVQAHYAIKAYAGISITTEGTRSLFPLKRDFNRIWWVCLVPTSTIRFASDLGYKMPKIY